MDLTYLRFCLSICIPDFTKAHENKLTYIADKKCRSCFIENFIFIKHFVTCDPNSIKRQLMKINSTKNLQLILNIIYSIV
jgi:hypothetical protein